MSTRYYEYNKDAFRPYNYSSTRVKKPTNEVVVSRYGAAPEGYYQAGTQTLSNKGGQSTYNIFRPLQRTESIPQNTQQASANNTPSTQTAQQQQQQTQQPQNNYQSEIDTLLETISSNQTAQAEAARQAQEAADQRMADLTSSFQNQMASMAQQQQQQIDSIMAANQQAMDRMIAEQQERARQMQIAQQTQAANAARASQTADFQIGTDRGVGGIGQFKRRLDIKPVTSSALAIAGADAKSSNKMLNV